MKYNIACSIHENTNIKNICSEKIKTIKIPYLQYFEFADVYAKGPDYICIQLSSSIDEDIECSKIFEYQFETADTQDVWQIYAESYDFNRCIIRHTVWDKKFNREIYLTKTHQIHEEIHSHGYDECTSDRTFNITLCGNVVLSNEVQKLKELWVELNARTGITDTVEKQELSEFVEKAIFVRNKDDCNFRFLWHYPLFIQSWEECIENIVRELHLLMKNETFFDGCICLKYAENDYDFLGIGNDQV